METSRNDRRGVRLILLLLLTTTVAAWAYPPGRPPALPTDAFDRAREVLPPQFVEYRTGGFVILSDCDPTWTRERAALLERARHQFHRVMDRLDVELAPPSGPLVCILIRHHSDYRRFAMAHDGVEPAWVSGYYATDANRVVFFDDASAPDVIEATSLLDRYEARARRTRDGAVEARRAGDVELAHRLDAHAASLTSQISVERRRVAHHAEQAATAKTIHEAIHLLSFNLGVQDPTRDSPFWFSEGLATSFEAQDADSAFGPDHPAPARLAAFAERAARGELLPLRDFVVLREAPTHDPQRIEGLYAQSHALFVYLFRFERRNLAAFIAALREQPPGKRSPEEHLGLFEAHFGDCASLERRLNRAYAAQ